MKPHRLRIHITRPGWIFIILSLGIGASALNSGNNLLYLIFGMMLSFLILSGLLSNNTIQRLVIRPSFPSRIFAQRPVLVRMQLENQKRYAPSYALSLRPANRSEGFGGGTFIVKIPPGAGTEAIDHIRFPHRGKVSLPAYEVETAYPFGLIRKSLVTPSAGETIVYPSLVEIDRLTESSRRMVGEYLSGQKGEGANPYGIRDFVQGDPARLIHWKSSAKQSKWRIKEFEKEKRLRVLLDVELAPKPSSEPQLLEKALSVATTLVLRFIEKGIELRVRLNGRDIHPEGRGYLDAYLSALALAEAPGTPPKAMPSEEVNTIVTVSDLPASQLGGDIRIGREEISAL